MITVVGIGADGWEGLTGPARAAVSAAPVLLGAPRQLALVPRDGIAWNSLTQLDALLDQHPVVVLLASGDPMHFGIGATLARHRDVTVIPAVSSISLACARLGWAVQEVRVVSLVGRRPSLGVLRDRERLLVLSSDATTPSLVTDLLAAQGFSDSELTVLSNLGGPDERVGEPFDALNVVGVECRGAGLPTVPGLPDDAFEHDGQITKREVRAVVLSLLAPQPGQLLWDVGAGTGSVAIEWSRAGGTAVAVERDTDKLMRIMRNAAALGVLLDTRGGDAPDALTTLLRPDAVFVGGGATTPGLLDACWDALQPGGRLVVNAVTTKSEAAVLAWQAKHGGSLTRLSVQRTAAVGSFTGWKPMTTVTIWSVTK
ncbi:MAG: precorrin-6y C5,15-methyltransferase (decarboxylating), CbiE subunit [Frankiales bacterium]|nr:precorrin-6y C5,15-methyltransferase (decarboxylating), CbiE subunit [Frankiales bacterium]